MKKMFTKLAGLALMITLLSLSFNGNAQTTSGSAVTTDKDAPKAGQSLTTPTVATPAVTTPTDTKAVVKPADADTSWKPVRRLWGYTFGDFYYDAHADATNRGSETMYNGVPTYRNAFQFRRIYLGYDYDINRNFTAEVLLASEPNANTGVNGTTAIQNGDNLVDGKMAFWIKNFNLRWRNIWSGTDFVIGEMGTPGFALNEPGTNGPNSLSETTWSYRSIEKTITDFHKNNSYDVGAALQGTFDPDTKNFGYVAMIGNNSQSSLLSASNPNTGFYKIFYGDLWAKFLNKHLLVDIYADYAKTAQSTYLIGDEEHNMLKGFVAYTSQKLSVGVEAYTQKLANAVTNSGTKQPEDATVHAISFWVRGAIVKDKVGFFARFDSYNPDTDFNTADAYTVNPNGYSTYNPTTKEKFYTAGLDFTPAPKIHFMPNIWLVDYANQGPTAATIANDHTLVYRLTFFYTFGK